jgi:hypothetical protein
MLEVDFGGLKIACRWFKFNPTADFVVSSGGKSAAVLFIYAGEGGMLAAWSKDVDVSNAVVMYTDGGGAV